MGNDKHRTNQRTDPRPHRPRITVLAAAILLLAPATLPAALADHTGPAPPARDTVETTAPHVALATIRAQLDLQALQTQDEHQLILLHQQHRNLDIAEQLLSVLDGQDEVDLATAAELSKIGTRHQALTLGLDPDAEVYVPAFDTPSDALKTLAQRHDAPLSPQDREALAQVDGHPATDEITSVVEAFHALERETRTAYANADLDALEAMRLQVGDDELQEETPAALLQDAGLDLSGVLAARTGLLDAVLALEVAMEDADPQTSTARAPTLAVPPAFAIDLDGTDTTYTEDIAFLIDVGGSDTYHNNAGGSNLANGGCGTIMPGHVAAAALVDLGTGVDAYGDAANPRGCGVNGGGNLGTGFLLDAGGSDTYFAGGRGVNGGSDTGIGFLLDVSGNEGYNGNGGGANGGSRDGGAGFLLDTGGSDTYTGESSGVNGGGRGGTGFLLDASGSDTYNGGCCVDGGGSLGGSINGGGGDTGVGFLLDAAGDDAYTAEHSCCSSFPADDGVNGGGTNGVGLLLDADGTDTYQDDAGGTGTDKTVVPKGTVGAQLDWPTSPASVDTCPASSGTAQACLTTGNVAATFGAQATFTGPSHAVAGYVDRYSFPSPTGGTVEVPCVTLAGDGAESDACAEAGGTFQERVLTLVDTEQREAEAASANTVRVCEATLTLRVAGFGLNEVGVLTVC